MQRIGMGVRGRDAARNHEQTYLQSQTTHGEQYDQHTQRTNHPATAYQTIRHDRSPILFLNIDNNLSKLDMQIL